MTAPRPSSLLPAIVAAVLSSAGCHCGGCDCSRAGFDAAIDAFIETDAGPGTDAAAANDSGSNDAGLVVGEIPCLPEAIYAPAAAAFGSTLWVAGGHDGNGSIPDLWRLDLEDVAAGWTAGPPMPEARAFPAYTDDGIRLYVAGGVISGDRNDDLFIFDSSDGPTGSWSTAPTMPDVIGGAGAGMVAGGSLFITGGSDAIGTVLSQILVYDLVGASGWQTTFPLPAPTMEHASATWNDHLFVLGGNRTGGIVTNEGFEWDPAAGWLPLPPMPTARRWAAGIGVGGYLLVIGGALPGGEPTGAVELYDTLAKSWIALDPVVPALGSAAVSIDNLVFLIGGLRTDGPTCEVEVLMSVAGE